MRRHFLSLKNRFPLLILCLASLLGVGCRAGWQVGRDHFRDARYPDAVREFSEAEADYPTLDRAEQAHYALYRGLTHLAVGDALAADGWLRIAKHESDSRPGLFTADELGRLDSAWRSLGHMPGQGALGPAWLAGREHTSAQ